MGGINPFSATGQPSAGGVTPQQFSYAQWLRDEGLIKNANQFASSGMGPSTGETQADAGANFGEAIQLAKMSDADAAAQASFQNAQQSAAKGNTGTAVGGLGSLLGGL